MSIDRDNLTRVFRLKSYGLFQTKTILQHSCRTQDSPPHDIRDIAGLRACWPALVYLLQTHLLGTYEPVTLVTAVEFIASVFRRGPGRIAVGLLQLRALNLDNHRQADLPQFPR